MRVRLGYWGDYTSACGTTLGEVEDYNVTIISPNTTITTKLNIEGFYDATTHALRPVRANQGVGVSPTDVDFVTLELRHPTTHALVATANTMLQTNGNATATFTPAISGSYYLVIIHRNALKTWSASPIMVNASTPIYDFTNNASKAYGQNMVQVELGVWAFYSGDVNSDDVIDGSDAPDLFNDVDNSAFGDLATDLNGDGAVDNTDVPLFLNNADSSIYTIRP